MSETRTQTTGLVGEKQRVLELAPAEERVARDLCQQGCHVVAVERDRATCTKLRRVCTEVVRGDIREVNLAQVLRGRKRFDAIVVGSLLQRSADPAALLARLLPYLDQRGSLVLTVDNAAHASVRLALLAGELDYGAQGVLRPDQLRLFTRDGVASLLEAAGLEMEQVECVRSDGYQRPSGVGPAWDPESVPAAVRQLIEQDPTADVARYVVRAVRRDEARAASPAQQVCTSGQRRLLDEEQLRAIDRPLYEANEARDRALERVEELQQQLDRAGQTEREQRDRQADLERALEEQRRMIAAANEQRAELERQLEQQRVEQQQELAALREPLAAREQQIADLERDLLASDERRARQGQLLERRDEEVADLEQQLVAAQQQLSTVAGEAADQRRAGAELRDRLQEQQRRAARDAEQLELRQQQITQLGQALADVREELAATDSALARSRDRAEGLRRRLQRGQERQRSQEQQLTRQQQTILEQERQLARATQRERWQAAQLRQRERQLEQLWQEMLAAEEQQRQLELAAAAGLRGHEAEQQLLQRKVVAERELRRQQTQELEQQLAGAQQRAAAIGDKLGEATELARVQAAEIERLRGEVEQGTARDARRLEEQQRLSREIEWLKQQLQRAISAQALAQRQLEGKGDVIRVQDVRLETLDRELDHAVARERELMQSLRGEQQAATLRQQQLERLAADLEHSELSKSALLERLSELRDTLAARAGVEARTIELERELAGMRHSLLFRVLEMYQQAKHRLLPVESRRREMVERVLGYLRGAEDDGMITVARVDVDPLERSVAGEAEVELGPVMRAARVVEMPSGVDRVPPAEQPTL